MSVMRAIIGFTAVLVVSAGAGCGGGKKITPAGASLVQVEPVAPVGASDGVRRYLPKSGDRLSLRVLNDPTLNSIVEIQMDGRVAVPWAGTVQAAGRPLAELEVEIEDSLKIYLRNPAVSLTIDAFGPSRVYVTGEVAVPGAYPIEAGQTVLGAIAAAGGLLTSASTKEVLLLRRVNESEATVHRVDVARVLKGSDEFADPLVQHLDIVHVPRSLIADIGVFVNQFFNQLRPAFGFYLDGWEAFNVERVQVVNVR